MFLEREHLEKVASVSLVKYYILQKYKEGLVYCGPDGKMAGDWKCAADLITAEREDKDK